VQTVLGSLFSGRTQGRQLATIAGVVLLRTLLQDRIATLNGRTVEHVLRQVGPRHVLCANPTWIWPGNARLVCLAVHGRLICCFAQLGYAFSPCDLDDRRLESITARHGA